MTSRKRARGVIFMMFGAMMMWAGVSEYLDP